MFNLTHEDMENPFEVIENRLSSIENILHELQLKPKDTQLTTPDNPLIRRKEARQLLGGISDPTIISYEKRGLIHPVRYGATILYNREELLRIKTR